MATRGKRKHTSINKKLEDNLAEYNLLKDDDESHVLKHDIVNLRSDFWENMVPLSLLAESEIPFDIRKSAIDSLYKKRRAEEEIGMLKKELPRVITYMIEQRKVILDDYQAVSECQNQFLDKKDFAMLLYVMGCSARLQYELYLLDGILRYFHQSFECMIQEGHIPGATLPDLPTVMETGEYDYYKHSFSQEEESELEQEISRYENEMGHSDDDDLVD